MTASQLLDLLDSSKVETLAYFDLPGADLRKTYGPGKWNIRQILHHLTDTEMLLHQRLKKVIAEPRQVIWAFNQDAWNDAFDYALVDLGLKKQVFGLCRDLNRDLVREYYDSHGSKEFVHSETGVLTLADEFQKVASHNISHLEQIKRALKL